MGISTEIALNRRFSNKWMMLASFGHTWSTTWNYKLIGRYVLPYDIGLSGSPSDPTR